ncbi:MAG: hypothetical protein ACE5OZ_04415 [Candidatus Heimdallarchaeota archaeon]
MTELANDSVRSESEKTKKEVAFSALQSLPEGHPVTTEGQITKCSPIAEFERWGAHHQMQSLRLVPLSTEPATEEMAITVFLWNAGEAAKFKVGERLRIVEGLLKKDRNEMAIHVIGPGHLERLCQVATEEGPPLVGEKESRVEEGRPRTAVDRQEIQKQAEEELQKICSLFPELIAQIREHAQAKDEKQAV